jgi:hypothetical protein
MNSSSAIILDTASTSHSSSIQGNAYSSATHLNISSKPQFLNAFPSRDTLNTKFSNAESGIPKSQAGISGTLQRKEVFTEVDVESEIISPNAKLLKFAQAASSSVVQIPADLLASLFTSIDDLKNDCQHLRNQVHNLTADVSNLQACAGMQFSLFPKLPLELRRMIWHAAAAAPRVISIKWVGDYNDPDNEPGEIVPAGPLNPLLLVSKEARTEVLKVQRPLPQLRLSKEQLTPQVITNSGVDTVWISGLEDTYAILYGWSMFAAEVPDIAKVALNHQFWQARENSLARNDFYYMMSDLEDYGTTELILVVGDSEPHSSPNIVFVEPQRRPSELLSEQWWAQFHSTRTLERSKFTFDDSLSWKMLEEEAMNFLRDDQAERTERRKAFIEGMSKSYNSSRREIFQFS